MPSRQVSHLTASKSKRARIVGCKRKQRDPLYPIIHLSFVVYERPTTGNSNSNKKLFKIDMNQNKQRFSYAEQRTEPRSQKPETIRSHAGKKNEENTQENVLYSNKWSTRRYLASRSAYSTDNWEVKFHFIILTP